jgi:hypothetical protein
LQSDSTGANLKANSSGMQSSRRGGFGVTPGRRFFAV